ncbi:hypothetical protein [uncultured Draconibacterium sp.]|uniref:hypothetical protein n=1 Tax=uncultured Draconibacterium sp. TaxID=1573823 RepID=UPI00321691C5
MIVLLIVSIVLFAAFWAVMWFVLKDKNGQAYGLQTSISATYKILLEKLPKEAHSIWIGLFVLLAIGIVSAGESAWYFGSAIGLLGVGAFPEYWEKDEVKKHIGAAYLAYLVPVVYMLFFDGMWITTVLALAWLVFAGLCSTKVIEIKNATAIYELIGFVVIVLPLF